MHTRYTRYSMIQIFLLVESLHYSIHVHYTGRARPSLSTVANFGKRLPHENLNQA